MNCKTPYRIPSKIVKISFIFLLGMSGAQAEVIPCQDNCVAKVAIPYLVKSVLASSAQPEKVLGCPDAGFVVSPTLEATQGSIVSSANIISGLVSRTPALVSKLNADRSHCGVCREMNTLTTFTTTSPQSISSDVSCQSQPVENVRIELENSEIESYVNQTLTGKNQEGQRLHQNCPQSCSFYVVSGQTSISASRSRLNLTVLCGQPRKGSLLFSSYIFTVGVIQQWACAK